MTSFKRWWRQYRYRFVPWLVFNLKNRSMRSVDKHASDKLLSDSEVLGSLQKYFQILHDAEISTQMKHKTYNKNSDYNSNKPSNIKPKGPHTVSRNVGMNPGHLPGNALDLTSRHLGFTIERRPSIVAEGGLGVVVTRGTISKGTVVALYPGAVYQPYEPILLQSIGNQFLFRCLDGLLVDGNDRGISKMIFKSCAGRDRLGVHEVCDTTWLSDHPRNPLAIGQYINNHNKEYPANVAYQECDILPEFPIHLRKFIPNVPYSPPHVTNSRSVRTVVLVALRCIAEGEELLSSYFTLVH